MRNQQRVSRKTVCLMATMVVSFVVAVPALVFLLGKMSQADLQLSLGLPAEALLRSKFDQFIATYNKKYDSESEYIQRLKIFRDNYNYINDYNHAHPETFLEINEMADMTHEEYSSRFVKPTKSQTFTVSNLAHLQAPNPIIDWRKNGVVAPVTTQQPVAALVVTRCISSLHAILTKQLVVYPTDILVQCTRSQGQDLAECIKYVQAHGISEAKKTDNCATYRGDFFVDDVVVKEGDNDQLLAALNINPVMVGVNANNRAFMYYRSGIITSGCGTDIDHMLLLVGAGNDGKDDYWIVQNNWGTSWGEAGYAKIKRDTGIGSGVCGIAKYPIYFVKKDVE